MKSLHGHLANYYRPYGWRILLSCVLLVLSITVNLAKPWPLKWVIDYLAEGAVAAPPVLPWGMELPMSAFLAACAVALVAVHLVWGWLNLVATQQLIRVALDALVRLRGQLFDHLQRLSLRFHDMTMSSDSAYRLAYDTQSIQTFFNRGFATVVGSVLTLAGIMAVMWRMNVFLTGVSLAVVPLLLWSIRHYAGRVRTESATLQEKESRVLAKAGEMLGGIRLIQSFTREEVESRDFASVCRAARHANLEFNETSMQSSLVVGAITALGTALLLFFGAREVELGHLAVGDLVVFVSYLAMLYSPLEQLSYTAWAMESAAAGAQRVFEVLDREPDIRAPAKPERVERPAGRVTMEGVSFAYEAGRRVLDRVTLDVIPGMSLGLVGGSGAGKTTLLSLLPRFYDALEGAVSLDGLDVRAWDPRELRRHMALVTQETLLFNASVADNLRFARAEARDDELWEALAAAQADEFVRSMTGGLEAHVGEHGRRLSGGQRQRLAIARAYLKRAPVLLLDEPTSALDPRTEDELLDTLRGLMKGRTTVIASHRLNVVHGSDRIVVLERGRVVETGTGPELVEQGGLYADLWRRQRWAG